ncbi:MFS transporter [Pseudonocardia sp. KRD-291]|nr:MFS transporter [Pseudonocardia sp. KRD291]MBW0104223.1 MFS transporter [Pseudonocardia sp. KRD291]
MSSAVSEAPVVDGPRSRALVGVLAFGGIVVALQQTSVIPLIPQFPSLLDASAADTTWIVTATLLAGAVATPMVGRLADMFGKRRMLLICLAMLVVGSVVGALSTSLVPLVVGRAIQGLATGVIPLGISLMRDSLPAERLGSATASMSASLGVGGALGLPLSALIAQSLDWHLLFWASAGLGVVVLALVVLLVPESPQRAGGRFDGLGAVLLSAALVCVLLVVSKGNSWGWGDPLTLTLLVVGVVALGAWGAWELRTPQPLVDLRVSRRRQVLLTNSASAVFGFSMFAMSLVFPQLLQLPASTGYGLGQSILVAGLVLAPGGLCMMAMSPVSARITNASGPRTTLMLGAVVVAVGYGLGVLFHSEVWHLVACSIVVSSGVGLAYGAMPSLVMAAVPVTQTAAANSLNNLARAIGTSTASAVAGVLLAALTTSVAGMTVPSEGAFILVMGLGGLTALVALAITAFIPPRKTPEETTAAAVPQPARAHPAPAGGAGDAGSPAPRARPLVTGTVHRAGVPVATAVLTVVATDGHELGRARSGEGGRFAVERSGPGRSRLLVVQSSGAAHARFLGDGADHLDLDLDHGPDHGPGGLPSRTDAGRPRPGEHGDADLVR